MAEWKRTGKMIRHDRTVNIYENGGPYTIESRLVHVPHANGRAGTWDYTSYFVVKDGKDVKSCLTLKHAKAVVEELEEGSDGKWQE